MITESKVIKRKKTEEELRENLRQRFITKNFN